jgi:hypothetical protein
MGLYLNPPEQALVSGVVRRATFSQMSLTQALLPLRPGM